MSFDSIVHGATLATAERTFDADIRISGGRIARSNRRCEPRALLGSGGTMSQQPDPSGELVAGGELNATVDRERVYELLAHLVASAELCVAEPHYYGSFRLLDAASKFAATMLGCGLDDPWLADLQAELDQSKILMMSDRPAFYSYLPQASRQVARRLLETAGNDAEDLTP